MVEIVEDDPEEDEDQEEVEQVAPLPPDPVPGEDSEISPMGFRVGSWKGFPNYYCPVCHTGFLQEEFVIQHILDIHPNANI